MYNFDNPIHRAGTDCVKWDGRESLFGAPDAIPMWVADTDFPAPREVLEALSQKITAQQALGYGVCPADFVPSLVDWLRMRHRWEIDPDWVCPAGGVLVSITQAVLAMTEPGDGVVVFTPVYDPFYRVIERNGRKIVRCTTATGEFGRWQLNLELLERELRAGAKAVILCNPHNPTGRVWTAAELQALGELCQRYHTLVISDDIHCDFAHTGSIYTPIGAACPALAGQLVQCFAPSKTFNIAGLKLSAAVIPDKGLREAFRQCQDRLFSGGPDILSSAAFTAAYRHGAAYADEVNAYTEANARYAAEFIAEHLPMLRTYVPEGTYLTLWDCSALGHSGKELTQWFIDRAGVIFSGGEVYGDEIGQCIRCNMGTTRAQLEQVLQNVRAALEKRV